MNDPLARYVHALETLERETIADLVTLCDPGIHFRDPFNDCRGVDAFARVMGDMFDKLDDVHFTADLDAWCAADESSALIHWTLSANMRAFAGKPWCVEGCSMLHFGDDHKVTAHYDYWDAASGLYEHLPLLGFLFRLLRRRIRVG